MKGVEDVDFGCATDCVDRCVEKYGEILFKGKTYYCLKGCVGFSEGRVTDSEKYCCGKNYETCKINCLRASSLQDEIENCDYGCEFWKENYNRLEIPTTCSKLWCLLFKEIK